MKKSDKKEHSIFSNIFYFIGIMFKISPFLVTVFSFVARIRFSYILYSAIGSSAEEGSSRNFI